MKKLQFVLGVLFLALSLVLVLAALLFPENGAFVALWDRGVLTFRGEGSLLVIYLVSGLSFLIGAGLLFRRSRRKEDV